MQELNKDVDIKIDNNIIARVEILRNEGDKDVDIYIHNVCDLDLNFNIEFIDDNDILYTIKVQVKNMETHLEENVKIKTDIIKLHSLDYSKTFSLKLTE